MKWAGAAEVHIVAASSRSDEPAPPHADVMAAFPREVAQAAEEGIVFHPRHTLSRLIVRNAHVAAVELSAVDKIAGRDHAVHRVTFEGTERIIPIDLVVPAIGEVVDPHGLEPVIGARGTIATDGAGLATPVAGVFAGGDALGNRGTVTAAIGDGQRASAAIDRYLRGVPEPAPAIPHQIGIDKLNLAYFTPAERHEVVAIPVEEAQRGRRGGARARSSRRDRGSGALPVVRQLHGLRQLLDVLPGAGGAEDARADGGRVALRLRLRVLQRLRHLRPRMPDRLHPDGRRSDGLRDTPRQLR